MREIKRKLTDSIVKNLKTKEKAYKKSDGGRLFVLVKPNGGKYWQYNYDKPIYGTHHIGSYPKVSLKEAREEHERARELILKGQIPESIKSKRKNDFKYYYEEWLSKQNLAESTLKDLKQRIRKNVLPYIGDNPIESHTTLSLLKMLERMTKRGAIESARRLAVVIRNVFDRALALEQINSNPAEGLKRLLEKPTKKKKNFAHIDNPEDLKLLLNAIYKPAPRQDIAVTMALRLMPMIFLRPKNTRYLKWSHINWDKKELYYSLDDIKKDLSFIVPLPTQAIEILKEIQPLTGKTDYVFTTSHGWGKPMNENTTTVAVQRLINEETGLPFDRDFITSHGFGHTASTLLNEMLMFDKDLIEVQLAHVGKDKIRTTYNKAKYLDKRHEIMQTWANYLDGLKQGADIVLINKKA